LERFRKNSDATKNYNFTQKTKKISKLHVKFSPLSINKNDKLDGEKITNISLTKALILLDQKIWNQHKNYLEDKTTREGPKINNSDQS
jgi:hypothetical protein